MDYALRKRILVTGGAGFLGTHLCKRLLDSVNDVLCIDHFFIIMVNNPKKCFQNNGIDISLIIYRMDCISNTI